ncbi:hypothetical protein MRB53_018045 [Persea americana]|uniref:Uncharacterized protein n=1 Tax=Persea americana TaxID=3435 RepID=A0ACC2M6B7_PERAE|nr:hypothetical protein MRB53_018045 [Persea americana]
MWVSRFSLRGPTPKSLYNAKKSRPLSIRAFAGEGIQKRGKKEEEEEDDQDDQDAAASNQGVSFSSTVKICGAAFWGSRSNY